MFKQLALRLGMVTVMTVSTIGLSGCGDSDTTGEDGGGIASVAEQAKDWIVAFATETGSYVLSKAEQFGSALSAAWTAFWGSDKVNNVIVDKDDPLKGKFDGILRCSVDWGGITDGESKVRDNSLKITLDHPRMVRTSEESTDWTLAPEETDRLRALEKQLLGNL